MTSWTAARRVWVPVLALVGGIVLATAVVNVVGRPHLSATPQPSSSGPASSASLGSASPSLAAPGSIQPTPAVASGWTISPFPRADPGDQLERIVQFGDQLFVVGAHAGQGAIWHSLDGAEWQLASATPTTHRELGAQIHGIAHTAAGYVAVGAYYVVDGAFPLIWHSPDGDHWNEVTPNSDECLPLQAVTATDARFVAVGAVCRYDSQAQPQSDGVSFASTDGVHWQRSPASPTLVDMGLEDVTWTGSELVAAGVYFGTWTKTLHSADGLTWSSSPGAGMPEESFARRIGWVVDRLVAFGSFKDSAREYHATVWWSDDGMEWHRQVVGAAKTQANAVALDGSEWVMVGGIIESDTQLGSFLEWRSADGLAWGAPRVIFGDGSGYFADMVSTGVGILGIGGIAPERSGDPWVPAIMRFGT